MDFREVARIIGLEVSSDLIRKIRGNPTIINIIFSTIKDYNKPTELFYPFKTKLFQEDLIDPKVIKELVKTATHISPTCEKNTIFNKGENLVLKAIELGDEEVLRFLMGEITHFAEKAEEKFKPQEKKKFENFPTNSLLSYRNKLIRGNPAKPITGNQIDHLLKAADIIGGYELRKSILFSEEKSLFAATVKKGSPQALKTLVEKTGYEQIPEKIYESLFAELDKRTNKALSQKNPAPKELITILELADAISEYTVFDILTYQGNNRQGKSLASQIIITEDRKAFKAMQGAIRKIQEKEPDITDKIIAVLEDAILPKKCQPFIEEIRELQKSRT